MTITPNIYLPFTVNIVKAFLVECIERDDEQSNKTCNVLAKGGCDNECYFNVKTTLRAHRDVHVCVSTSGKPIIRDLGLFLLLR